MSVLNVAVVGAGPAGIYAADILSKSGREVKIDIFERLPAPYGLVRYGVAPDHPRIKQIINALYSIIAKGEVHLVGNVEVGKDVTIEQLREHYDAVIIATGSDLDAPLDIPGVDLEGCYGAADFVAWYDGHPDYPREWNIEGEHVAVLGVGNVGLDVARILAKDVEDLMVTEIPANVEAVLRRKQVTDVHVFGRRGPAQVKFTPLELRELGHVPGVDVVVREEDMEFDEGSQAAIAASKQTKMVVKTLTDYAMVEDEERTAPRRIHIHLFESPVEVLGEDGRVVGLRTERTRLTGDGNVEGTGETTDWPVSQVYRAIGYFSSPVQGVPYDPKRGLVPNVGGRVLEGPEEGAQTVAGLYATGWIKRGPVGLIGSTKSDAQETIANLLADVDAGLVAGDGQERGGAATLLPWLQERGVEYTTSDGWITLDEYERKLGQDAGRERIKVVSREAMTAISRGQDWDGPLL